MRVRGVLLLAVVAGCSSSAVAVDENVIGTTIAVAPSIAPSTTTSTTVAAPTTPAPTTATTQPAPVIIAAQPAATQPPATDTTLPSPQPIPAENSEAYVELGSIEIPAIGVSKALLEGVTMTTLDRGPGHWPGTAMPGQQGNVVVAGHRVSHDRPFRDVDQLTAGDEVIMTTGDGRFVYHVVSIEIVRPDAVWIVNQTPEHTATLFACHPPGSTRERIVVHLALAQ
jgi:sortase A